jgi:hypothetical protein
MPLTLNRRAVIGSLASGLLVSATGPVSAEGFMPMRAIRQFALGNMKISVIDDGSFSMGAGMHGCGHVRCQCWA